MIDWSSAPFSVPSSTIFTNSGTCTASQDTLKEVEERSDGDPAVRNTPDSECDRCKVWQVAPGYASDSFELQRSQ